MAKYSNTVSDKPRVQVSEEIYKSMCDFKRDHYEKEIIEAHKDVIEAGTKFQIEDITWRFNKKHISIHEMFTELEGLKSGHKVTDSIVKDAMNYARRTYCKGKKNR